MLIKFLGQFDFVNREVLQRRATAGQSTAVKDGFAEALKSAESPINLGKTAKWATPELSQTTAQLEPPVQQLSNTLPLAPAPVPQIRMAKKRYEAVEDLTSPKAMLAPTSVVAGGRTVEQSIKDVGRQVGIDPLLGLAVAKAESSLNSTALSSDGHSTKGLFQLKDTTGKDVMARLGISGQYDPYNPELNMRLGLSHLLDLHSLFKSGGVLGQGVNVAAAEDSASLERFALSAFNAGQGRVAAAQQQAVKAGLNPGDFNQVKEFLPAITRNYVERIISDRDLFASQKGADE